MKPTAQGVPLDKDSSPSIMLTPTRRGKIMLIGVDRNHVIERRFQSAGYEVLSAGSREAALNIARRQELDGTLILSQDSLLNVAETIFNLRDLCPGAKIIVLLQHGAKTANRFIHQMLDHRIAGSEIMTRRELQKSLREPHFLSRQRA
jgi:hypothetical protein